MTRPKRLAARLIRFDGAYLRFSGPMTITVFNAGSQTERYTEAAIWELMYFGHARRPTAT